MEQPRGARSYSSFVLVTTRGVSPSPNLEASTPTITVGSSVEIAFFELFRRYFDGTHTVKTVAAVSIARYRELSSAGVVERLWLRFLMYVGYPCRLAWSVLTARRGSVFVVSSNTFYAPLLAASLGHLRGNRVLELKNDLFPDALEAAGLVASGGAVVRLLSVVPRWSHRLCDAVVFVQERLGEHARRRYGEPRRWAVIDFAGDEGSFPRKPGSVPFPLRLHYGGQLGRMHGAATLARCVRAAVQAAPECRFDFRVGGPGRSILLRELAGEPAVALGPTVGEGAWRDILAVHHVGLVTLTPAGATVSFPSKAYGMLAGGLALLAVCPRWSDLGRILEETGAGWVVDNSPYTRWEELQGPAFLARSRATLPDDVVAGAFAALVRQLASDPEEVDRRRAAALAAAQGRFAFARTAEKWREAVFPRAVPLRSQA